MKQRCRPKIQESWRSHPGMNAFVTTLEDCWDHDAEARFVWHNSFFQKAKISFFFFPNFFSEWVKPHLTSHRISSSCVVERLKNIQHMDLLNNRSNNRTSEEQMNAFNQVRKVLNVLNPVSHDGLNLNGAKMLIFLILFCLSWNSAFLLYSRNCFRHPWLHVEKKSKATN